MCKRSLKLSLFMALVLSPQILLKAQTPKAVVIAIKAGRLIDPETGTAATNQIIIIEGERIKFFHPGPVRTPNGRWTR